MINITDTHKYLALRFATNQRSPFTIAVIQIHEHMQTTPLSLPLLRPLSRRERSAGKRGNKEQDGSQRAAPSLGTDENHLCCVETAGSEDRWEDLRRNIQDQH